MEMNWFKLLTKIIYTTYESEITSVYQKVLKFKQCTYASFKADLQVLENQGLIHIANINLGIRGGRRSIIQKTEEGENYALMCFDSIHKEREAERLLREHTSLEHGYFIKYCCELFKEAGYNVFDRYEDNKFETNLIGKRGKKLVCESDFSIEEGGELFLFEAETGKCQKENTIQKLDKELDLAKNNKINSTVFIICPCRKACDKTQIEVDSWYFDTKAYNDINVVILNASLAKEKIFEEISKYIKKEEAV